MFTTIARAGAKEPLCLAIDRSWEDFVAFQPSSILRDTEMSVLAVIANSSYFSI